MASSEPIAARPLAAAPTAARLHELDARRPLLVRRPHKYRQLVGIAYAFVLTLLGAPPGAGTWAAGVALAIAGELVRLWAAGHVHKNVTLTRTGPYAWVRHPLYTGNTLIALGLCLASWLWWSLPVYALFHVAFVVPTIRREDRRLYDRHPEQWEAWGPSTPAIVPRPPRADASRGRGEWSLRQCLVANGEPIYALVLSGCLAYLYFRIG